jgi:PAS domain S-box-containing protein
MDDTYAAITIENIQFYIEAERHQREIAEMMRDLVATVNSTLDIDQVLNIAVERLQALHRATACSVSFLDKDGKNFVFRATTDPGIDVSQHITFAAKGSIAGRAIRQHKVQILNNVDLLMDYRAEIARRTGVISHSLLTAPLFSDDKPLGVIQVLSASPHAFGDADAELLATTAALIETAITRAQAYTQAVQLAQSEHYQREVAETLQRVATLINASLDLDIVLDRILEQLAQVIDYDSASLMLIEGNQLAMRARRSLGGQDKVPHPYSAISGNPLFQEMLETRRPIVIPDVAVDDRFQKKPPTLPVRSWIGVPLVVRDRVIGQLAVDKYQPNTYDEADARLVSVFAQQAAVAIQNAQLFEAEQRQRKLAEALRQAGAALNSTLNYEEVLDRILEQVGLVVPHDAASIMLIKDAAAYIFRWRGYDQFGSDAYIASTAFNISDVPHLRIMRKTGQPVAISRAEGYAEWISRPEMAWVKSHAGAPIQVRGQVIGFLNVDSATPGFFSQADAERLQTFAQQAAIAIENAQLFEGEQRQRQMAESLQQVAATLNTSLDRDTVLAGIMEQLRRVVEYDSASILLHEGEDLVISAMLGDSDPAVIGHRIPLSSGAPAVPVFKQQRPAVIADVQAEPGWTAIPGTQQIRGWMGVPLLAGEKPIGVLAVDSFAVGAYDEKDTNIVQVFANQAAIAIENARLYEDERKRLAEVERRNQELAALHAVAAAVSSSLNPDVVLREALSRALEVRGMEAGGVHLLDETGNTLVLRIHQNLTKKVVIQLSRLQVGEGISGQVVQTGEPLVAEDVAHDTRLSRPGLAEAGFQTMVVVPLKAQGRILGTFFSVSPQQRRVLPEDLNLLAAIGDEMGVAVENARLHQTLQNYAAELEARVEARTAELNRERERLLAVLESAGDAIVITDNHGTVDYVNPTWERLTGFSSKEAIGHPLSVFQSKQIPLEVYNKMWSTIQAGWVWRGDLLDQRSDGAPLEVNLTLAPVFHENGDIVNFVGVFRDVSHLKKLERMKDEFLSTAAHELRNPITSILGFSELLLTRADLLEEERERFLHYINEHASHLKKLVGDLLDISRIDSGAGIITRAEPLSLSALLEQEMQAWQAANPKHTYHLQADDHCPKVYADHDRVLQVIRNLLSNATKYSPSGGTITLCASPVGGYLEITVADEGIGMTDEELTHLFEKFWRADASSTAIGGTGLGLVIVRHIVEQHGGHIWIDSVKGKGTTVHFTLPLVDRQPTVLVVEDEDTVREIEERILTNSGLAVLSASRGEEALKIAQARRPDLVLLDLMMPGMGGKEVAFHLKANKATAYIPVLVVSARSDWETIEETYALGVVDFLTKPFEYQELLARVRRALKGAMPQAASAANGASAK